jgi:uncharacterized HAD superfamily protein
MSKGKKLKIAMDLDGVLADVMENWIEIYNKEHEKEMKLNDIYEWDFWQKIGLSQEKFDSIFNKAWKNWRKISGTEENLSKKVEIIREFGEMDIVTGRSIETIEYVKKWMEYKKITYNRLVIVRSDAPKAHLDYDIFIDDSPIHALSVSREGKIALLYNQPWNRKVVTKENLIRVSNLDTVIEHIKNLKK